MVKHYFYCEYEPNSYMCRLLSFGFKELRLQWALKWFTLSNCKVVGRLIAYTTNAYPKASTVCALKTIQQCAWLTSSSCLQNGYQAHSHFCKQCHSSLIQLLYREAKQYPNLKYSLANSLIAACEARDSHILKLANLPAENDLGVRPGPLL